MLTCFFWMCFFGTPFGGQRVAQELPKGVVLRHLFTLLGCLVGYLFLASIFEYFLGCPREGKQCVFYVRVVKNRCSAFPEKVLKFTSKMDPFWYPFGTRWLTLGISRNRSKNVPQKCGTWCPKGAQMESLSEPNRGQIRGKKQDPIFDPPRHPFG